MKKVTLMFEGITMIDVVIKREWIGEFSSADIFMHDRYIGQLDTDTHRLKHVSYFKKPTYKVERR